MSRRFLFLVSFMMLSALSLPQLALADTTIAIVNLQKIMKDSIASQSVRDQMNAKKQQFQDQMKAKESDLKKQEQSLQQQKSVLSPEAFQQKVAAFQQQVVAAQNDANAKSKQLEQALGKSLEELQSEVVKIIGEMSKNRNITVAIPSNQALYFQPQLDITDEVLKQLNQRLTKITLHFEPISSSAPARN